MISALSIGIMQGRLLPPIKGRIQCFPADQWRDEFLLAKKAGLHLIEWIYEVDGEEANPLSTDEGIEELKALSHFHGVCVRSLCADYFMDRPLLLSPEEGVSKLQWLIGQSAKAGIRRIILPFVDASRLSDEAALHKVVVILQKVTDEVRASGLEVHLETDLAPTPFASLMGCLSEDVFFVNYDSGNSASHGYRVEEEFAAYGARISSLHIKDRVLGGGTVPLGSGNVDFKALKTSLNAIEYQKDVILQVARSTAGEEVKWAIHNRQIVESWL